MFLVNNNYLAASILISTTFFYLNIDIFNFKIVTLLGEVHKL